MKKLFLLLAASLSMTSLRGAEEIPLSVLRDPELVAAFTDIPVQEAGRIKPLDTVARYRLLRFHGTRTLRFDNKETGKADKLSAMEWMLITWFKPEFSKTLPLFRVDSPDAVTEIGAAAKDRMEGVKGKYTYNDLVPFRATLMEKADEYRQLDPKQRTSQQRMIADLGVNFLDFEMLLTHWDVFRQPFGPEAKSLPEEIKKASPAPHQIGQALPALLGYLASNPSATTGDNNEWLFRFVQGALGARMSGNDELTLRIFPPAPGASEQWHGPGWIIMDSLRSKKVEPADLAWLTEYGGIVAALPDAAKFKATAIAFAEKVKAAAKARGEGQRVPMESAYHRADYFYYALCLFVFAIVLLGLAFVKTGSLVDKICTFGAWLSLLGASGLAVTGIVIRCLIMQRPPIGVLYETIIFIGTGCALLGLIAELIIGRKIGLLVAALSGAACLFLSIRFETHDAGDTMVQLQAVLITNFWLATHVPMINLGYAASFVASIVSAVYLLARLFGLKDRTAMRDFTSIAYGFLAIGLFLSLVGTVMGGIWANYSWGRFWGWDPKENGALMIVLMILITLHARLGGYIREVGLHACNLLLGSITLFSWFGTNQLGVGLHAYGFTDGVWGWLRTYWVTQGVLLVIALFIKLREKKPIAQSPAAEELSAPT